MQQPNQSGAQAQLLGPDGSKLLSEAWAWLPIAVQPLAAGQACTVSRFLCEPWHAAPELTCAMSHALVLLLLLLLLPFCACAPAVIRFFGGRQAATNFVLSAYEPELAAMESQVRGAPWCSGRRVGPAA